LPFTLGGMDAKPIPSIAAAIAYGRGRRGWKDPAPWIRYRAQLLTALYEGISRAQLAADLALAPQNLERLIAEACDAVLRGRVESPEADVACAETWRRWCGPGNPEACRRGRSKVRP
jgi:hypothetical protein